MADNKPNWIPAPELTYQEMKAEYGRIRASHAAFRPNYKEGIVRRIEGLRKAIITAHEEVDVGQLKESLHDIFHNYPLCPPVDPTEPRGLGETVEWRMRTLKSMLNMEYWDVEDLTCGYYMGDFEKFDRRNIEAILQAYRTKELGPLNNDEMTVWFAGHLVLGPTSTCRPAPRLKPGCKWKREIMPDPRLQVYDRVPEWTEKYGPGRVRIEENKFYEIRPRKKSHNRL